MGSLRALTVTTHCLAPEGLGFVTIVLWSGTQSQPQVQRACQGGRHPSRELLNSVMCLQLSQSYKKSPF